MTLLSKVWNTLKYGQCSKRMWRYDDVQQRHYHGHCSLTAIAEVDRQPYCWRHLKKVVYRKIGELRREADEIAQNNARKTVAYICHYFHLEAFTDIRYRWDRCIDISSTASTILKLNNLPPGTDLNSFINLINKIHDLNIDHVDYLSEEDYTITYNM